jgi:hypothetical protein
MAGRFSLQFPGRRDASDPWFRVGTIDVTTTTLVSAVIALSMFVWAISPRFVNALALDASAVRSGEVWRIATWPLSNEPSLWTVIGIAVFWLVGNELERATGRNRFAWFLVTVTLAPAIIGTLLDLDVAGFRVIQFLVILVYIAEYPFVRFMFNIPAWVLGVVFLGLEILQLTGARQGDGLVFLFVTLAVGAIAARSIGLFNEYPWIPRLGGGRGRRSGRTKTKKVKRATSAGTVVAGPWAAPSGPSPADQSELDGLLDKISASGMDSLSKADKQRLNELSKRLRGG